MKMAHPKLSDKEIIRDTVLSMSPSERSYINLMKDIDELSFIVEFKSLVRRYDQKIRMTEHINFQPSLTAETFEKLLSSAVEKVVDSMKEKSDTLAAARQIPAQTASTSAGQAALASPNEPVDRDDSSSESSDGTTDGSEVVADLNHCNDPPHRAFLLLWEDDSRAWVREKDCSNCAFMVKDYIGKKNIEIKKCRNYKKKHLLPQTRLRLGFSGEAIIAEEEGQP